VIFDDIKDYKEHLLVRWNAIYNQALQNIFDRVMSCIVTDYHHLLRTSPNNTFYSSTVITMKNAIII
jgi:hypothetical protein